MKGRVRAFLASARSTRRAYSLAHDSGAYEIRRGSILIYSCANMAEAEAMMLELEMGRK